LRDFAELVINKALREGADHAEAFAVESDRLSVEVEKWEPKIGTAYTDRGLGLRVIVGGAVGFAYTTSFTPQSAENLVKRAISVAKLRRGEISLESFASGRPKIRVEGIYDEDTAGIPAQRLIDDLKRVVDKAKSMSDKLKSLSARISVSSSRVLIVNSEGLEAGYSKTLASAYVSVVAEEGGVTSTGYDYASACRYADLDFASLTEKAVDTAVSHLKREPLEGGTLTVILEPEALRDLLVYALLPATFANNVQEGRSFLRNKLGEELFSAKLTIIDDATIPSGVGSRPFDDEGVESRKLTVVRNGVLNAYLYDLIRAYKDSVESTGHATRGYSSEPRIAFSNVVLEFGDEVSLDEAVGEVKKGLIVRSLVGAHTSNPATGSFSVAVNHGYIIENGELGPAVKAAMIAGNIAEVLKEAKLSSKEKEWRGRLKLPYLLVEKISVST